MELVGTIIAVLPAQSGVSARTGNPWMSQDYVIEVPGQYPKKCCFRLFGEDRIRQFNIQAGEQNLTVQFDIDAHEYQGKWFNEIRAYNIIRVQAQQTSQAPQASSPQPAQAQPTLFDQGQQAQGQAQTQAPFPPQQQGDNPDDLPF